MSRAISEEELDTRSAGVRQAEASLAAVQAAVDSAALDVEFTHVTAPVSGRVGRALVDEGNLVSGGATNATLLTTIVSLDPIHVYFEADERSHLRYMRLAQSGERASSREEPNPVWVGLADEEGFPHEGWMDFVDNQLDPQTGTMTGRAVLPNPDLLLSPGLFARVRLAGSGPYRALLVPDASIGTDQARRFVWVADEQNRVQYRSVKTGPLRGELRVIREGLTSDDRVVVAGVQRVRPDTQVVAEETSLEEAAAALDEPTGRVDPAPGEQQAIDAPRAGAAD
jgi:RND family efflux transporter MFP subunit